MNSPVSSGSAPLKRHGILPGDGFVWRFAIVLFIHGGGLLLIVSSMKKPLSLVLPGDLGGAGGAAPVAMNEVNWVDVSVKDVVASLPKLPGLVTEEPESDLPLPQSTKPPAPRPEPIPQPPPKPAPPKEVVLKAVPKPETPKEVVLKPASKPTPEPPKSVDLKPAPAPKPVVLKPAPKAAIPEAKPPVPVSPPPPGSDPPTADPVRAVPLPGPVAASVKAGPGSSSGSGSNGFGAGPGGSGGPLSPISAFHLRVKEVYFSEWQQPHGLVESGSKYRVRVEIVIGRQGDIVSARVVAKSGNAEMDRSVQEAVSRVSQVEPLPTGVGGATYAILLNFDI